mgnify:CR=1 FL=1
MAKLKITLVKSAHGQKQKIRDTVQTLGLRKISQETVREDTPIIRGQIRTIRHLVDVEEID